MISTVKVRFVRCPECRQILPESPDVPVYQCGGCGKLLKAKIQTSNASSQGSDADAAWTNKLKHVSEDIEPFSSKDVNSQSYGECSVAENELNDQAESINVDCEQLGGVNSTDEDQMEGNFQNKSENLTSEHLQSTNLSDEEQQDAGGKNESHSLNNERLGATSLIYENQKGSNITDELSHRNIEERRSSSEVSSPTKLVHLVDESLLQLGSANQEAGVNDESSGLSESESEAQGILNSAKLVSTTEGSPVSTSNRPKVETKSPDIFASSPNEDLELSPGSDKEYLNIVTSTDNFHTAACIDPSSELSGILIDLSKSPTTKSSRAYYEDWVPSHEETKDRLSNWRKHSSKSSYKPDKSTASNERASKEKSLVHVSHEIQDQQRNPFYHANPIRDRNVMEQNGYSCQRPSHHGFLSSYENGSSSSQLHNGFSRNSRFSNAQIEKEKIKLLRMVHELQDQLDNARISNERAGGRVSGGLRLRDQHVPMYHDHEILQDDFLHNQPLYPGRLRDASNLPPPSKYSHMPFSTNKTNSLDQSLHCNAHDWQLRTHLSETGHHRGQFHMAGSSINASTPYGSCPSSPKRFVNSHFSSYGRGKMFDKPRYDDHEVKGECHLTKRHLRPVAGGAPFVTCTHCCKQLQLPTDFLLVKRKCHKVICSACSEVLKFTLYNGRHLIPYTPSSSKAPPPSEAGYYSDSINRRTLGSTSHMKDMDPTMSYEDNRPSFSRSISTDLDRGIRKDNADNYKKLMSNSEERGKHGNKYKNTVETHQSAGCSNSMSSSTNTLSEIDQTIQQGASPLHLLMGYSSARYVMYD